MFHVDVPMYENALSPIDFRAEPWRCIEPGCQLVTTNVSHSVVDFAWKSSLMPQTIVNNTCIKPPLCGYDPIGVVQKMHQNHFLPIINTSTILGEGAQNWLENQLFFCQKCTKMNSFTRNTSTKFWGRGTVPFTDHTPTAWGGDTPSPDPILPLAPRFRAFSVEVSAPWAPPCRPSLLFRSTPSSRPNKVGLKCPSSRPYVRPSTRSLFDFNEILYVGRGRWVMYDGMQYDPIQGQGHEPLKVGNSAISKGYLLPHL